MVCNSRSWYVVRGCSLLPVDSAADCRVATAIQHICMAKALIQEHDCQSSAPIRGPDDEDVRHANVSSRSVNYFAILTDDTKDEIMANLSILFGIALSVEDDPSARIMACHALCAREDSLPPLLLSSSNFAVDSGPLSFQQIC